MTTTAPDTAQEFLQLIEESLEQAKQAYNELQNERTERIRLEKIASEQKSKAERIANDIVGFLVREDCIDESEMAKYAGEVITDPDRARDIINHLLRFSSQIPEEGIGISKQASANSDGDHRAEDDAWYRVVEEGA